MATGSAHAAATEDTAAEYISTEDTREGRCIETTLHLAEEGPVEESEVLEAVEDFEPTEATVDDNADDMPTKASVTEREAVVLSDAVSEDVVTEDLTTENFVNEDLASEFVEDHVAAEPVAAHLVKSNWFLMLLLQLRLLQSKLMARPKSG